MRDSFTPNAIATDSSGNIYLAGNAIVDPSTSQTTVLVVKLNPQTSGGNLGTAPTTGTERSFVAKLDPAGQLVFSDFLGGSTNSYPQAVAVNAGGRF